jgi:hypothetical protein
MTTNQEGVHQALRDSTATSGSYSSDWHALFDADGIAAGPFNSRMLAWINQTLAASYTNVIDAMRDYAVDQGFERWTDINTLILGGGSGPTGDGILLEDGTSFLLAENNDFLILE